MKFNDQIAIYTFNKNESIIVPSEQNKLMLNAGVLRDVNKGVTLDVAENQHTTDQYYEVI